MIKKDVIKLSVMIASLVIIIGIGSLFLPDPTPLCPEGQKAIRGDCCFDINNDFECDSEYCGDGVCKDGEDCSTCWKDCGACKIIIYKYVPKNYTLNELNVDLSNTYPEEVKFKKDIYNSNDLSTFFYATERKARTIAFFLDIFYRPVLDYKKILLSDINDEGYYVNTTESLIKYVNYTKWYSINAGLTSLKESYFEDVTSGNRISDYPTRPTGHDKTSRYEDWKYANHSLFEDVLYDYTEEIEEGIVESVFLSTSSYSIRYRIREYELDNDEDSDDPPVYLDEFKYVDEVELNYAHTLNMACSDDLMITIFSYNYHHEKLNDDLIEQTLKDNRAELLKTARQIKAVCDAKYSNGRFIY